MLGRTWGPNNGGIPVNADNLNGIEADLTTALFSVAALSTKTSNYTLTSADSVVVFNGSNLTATLPDPTTVVNRVFTIKNLNATVLAVASAGSSKTIDGKANTALAQWDQLEVVSDGSAWLITSGVYQAPTPTLRASASNYGNSGANTTITIPATAQVGDLLVVGVGSDFGYGAGSSQTAGWTLLGTPLSQGWHNMNVFYKVCAAGDPGSTFTATLTGSEFWNTACAVVQNWSRLGNSRTVQTQTGPSVLTTAPALDGRKTSLLLMFGSIRVASQTPTFGRGTAVLTRNTDANLSSTLWTVMTNGSIFETLTSPVATQGMSIGVVEVS